MADYSNVVRQVLFSDTAEQEMKRQMILVAAEHLMQDAMPEILVEAFEKETVTAIRDQLLELLIRLDVSRFKDPEKLYSAFLSAIKRERSGERRKILIARVVKFLHHDPRILPLIIELLPNDTLSGQERLDLVMALNKVPRIDPEVVIVTLRKARYAPTAIQEVAVNLALRLPSWNADIVCGLYPYLDRVNDSTLRSRIIEKFKEVKILDGQNVSPLIDIARNEPDTALRRTCLEVLATIRPITAEIILQFFWSAKYDQEREIRKAALRLQNNIPKLTVMQIKEVIERMYQETHEGVRIQVLENIKHYIRDEKVRETVLRCFLEHPSVDADEFDRVIGLLRPYLTRDENIRDRLLDILPTLPRVEQRQALIDSILSVSRMELILDDILNIFKLETNQTLRSVLFNKLKALSVSKHLALAVVFSQELKEPGSPFRLECANAISSITEISSHAKEAIEDVLVYDTDRELIRVALKSYLKPNVEKRFDVLIAVAENEILDIKTRKEAVEEMSRMDISAEQKDRLANSLSNSGK